MRVEIFSKGWKFLTCAGCLENITPMNTNKKNPARAISRFGLSNESKIKKANKIINITKYVDQRTYLQKYITLKI